jgi:ubiquinone/menaquinone biosynthesis C-methylase UbiE
MKRLSHIGILALFKEILFKRWLDKNAFKVLAEIGVGSGQVVLDFGCGPGTYTIPAAKLVGESGRVHALDVDKGALERVEKKARKEGLNNVVRIESSGGEAIPLGAETIDVVLLIDVLQEIKDIGALFSEVRRIVKPNGKVFVFPMHIGEEEAMRLAKSMGFTLEGKKARQVLAFSR